MSGSNSTYWFAQSLYTQGFQLPESLRHPPLKALQASQVTAAGV